MDDLVLLTAAGRQWKLQAVTPGVRSEYCAAVKSLVRQEIFESRATMPAAMYRDELENFHESVAAGAYSWGPPGKRNRLGKAVSRYLYSQDGQIRLTQILLRDEHGEVSDDMVYAIMEEAPEAHALALQEAMGLAPNAKAAETPPTNGTAGSPDSPKTTPASTT